MKKILFFVFLLIFVWRYAYADIGQEFANDLASKLVTQKGNVIGVKNSNVILDKGSNSGIMKGELVYIYKDLGEFVDPTTNKTVDLKEGRAYAVVESIEPNKSVAKILRGAQKIQKYFLGLPLIPNGYTYSKVQVSTNDKWVIGKSEYRIAIITRNPVLFDSVKNALESKKEFEVLNADTIEIALTKEKITSLSSPSDIQKLCEDLNCDFVIPIYLKNNNQLSYNIYNGYTGDLIYAVNAPLSVQEAHTLKTAKVTAKVENIPPENIVPSKLNVEASLTFWESLLNKFGLYSKYSSLGASSATMRLINYQNVGYSAKALGIAGEIIVVANRGEVIGYRFDGYSLNKIFSARIGYQIFNIDTANINGKTYLAISNFDAYGRLSSVLASLDGNTIKIIKSDIPYAIRFYNAYANLQLIAQGMSIGSKFYGPIYYMNLDGKTTKEFDLPIKPASFFEFDSIGSRVVYVTPNNEIAIYDTSTKKNELTGHYVSESAESIQRYTHNNYSANESYFDRNKGKIFIQNSLKFYKQDSDYYILVPLSYRSNVVQVAGSHYNAYSLTMYKLNDNKLIDVWSSGSVSGRIVSFARSGDYVMALIATPSPFFTRFILGENDIYRLTVFEINK